MGLIKLLFKFVYLEILIYGVVKMENTHNFLITKTNLMGIGAIKDLPNELLSWKLSKALIVTDKNLIKLGHVENVEIILKNLFIDYDIFEGVLHPNPTVSFVEDGLSYFPNQLNILKKSYDLIISIGGGTNHDCARAIATVATNGGSIIDYEGYKKATKPMMPLICINTTGGSGAELTDVCIIKDNTRKVKMTLVSPMMIPMISVNDPMFMTTMPKEITATSGIDAITHAIEGYISTEASPITDSLCLKAINMTFEYLPRAYENGNDMEAREQMMFASVMGGMVISNAGLGYVHALSHQLGGFYNHVHGNYNAILLPHVFEFNSASVPEERILNICRAMGIKALKKSIAVEKIMKALEELRHEVGITQGLKELGVNESDLELLSENALKDIVGFTNPRQGTVEDIMKIFRAAM